MLDIKLQFFIYLMQFVIIPYRTGGDDPMLGFDCSGAVIEWNSYHGIQPPHDMTAQDLFFYYKNQGGEIGKIDMGSLAFFGSKDHISHVAMFINDKQIIEARGGDSTTVTLDDAIKRNAFITVRPYTHRKDLVSIIKPKGLPW